MTVDPSAAGSAGAAEVEDLLRELAPQVLGAVVRRHGRFDAAEDAVQEALLAAATQWPTEGLPDSPRGWLVTVASRRLLDEVRSEVARRRREDQVMAATPASALVAAPADAGAGGSDDSLTLLFLCCHPALSVPSQIALTLRAVGGLTTAQIAAAFLVPEATMAQRISRAKQTIRADGLRFTLPAAPERDQRLQAVLHVLYLIFNEGYSTTAGPDLTAPHLSDEAIRLTRLVVRLLPDHTEARGLLALMLLTDARRPARTTPDGTLVPLADQDRTRWNQPRTTEGIALIESALAESALPQSSPAESSPPQASLASSPPHPHGAQNALGPYQLQAAIAAVHNEAPDDATTDWPQILALYDLLERLAPNPLVTLNRIVAVARVQGPAPALAALATLAEDPRMARHHRLLATRAHLHALTGNHPAAATDFTEAARRTTSTQERRHLSRRAAEEREAGAEG